MTRVYYPARGFIAAPADTGLRGDALDALIAREVAVFAARGESVEWKSYGYDEPSDLTDRLVAAGFEPEDQETLLVGTSDALSGLATKVDGIVIR